jgi:hypothetical protein
VRVVNRERKDKSIRVYSEIFILGAANKGYNINKIFKIIEIK